MSKRHQKYNIHVTMRKEGIYEQFCEKIICKAHGNDLKRVEKGIDQQVMKFIAYFLPVTYHNIYFLSLRSSPCQRPRSCVHMGCKSFTSSVGICAYSSVSVHTGT